MPFAAKISSKGQITLPRQVRQVLNSNIVELEIVGKKIMLAPVNSVAGALAKYAKPDSTPIDEIREQVWREVARERQK
jgi:bifunctional DNA-binding transcriptional regulator/antitoxin component of YhaV-PrlF toxin-antitoxin module